MEEAHQQGTSQAMSSIGGMPEAEVQIAIRDVSGRRDPRHHGKGRRRGEADPTRCVAGPATPPRFRSLAAVSVVIFSLPVSASAVSGCSGPERVTIKSGMARGESYKYDGISMDSLITAAARALAAGDALGGAEAGRVARRSAGAGAARHRDGAARRARRARASCCESAARGFGPHEPWRARAASSPKPRWRWCCATWAGPCRRSPRRAATLEAHGDRANARMPAIARPGGCC